MPEPRDARDRLLHPLVLAALALWLLNDHVLKALWPGWLTGKLSDAAGMIVFPCFVAALLSWLLPKLRPRTDLWLGIALTMLGMAAVKLTPAGAWAYQHGLGLLQWPMHALSAALHTQTLPGLRSVRLAMDASDLLTLPFAAVPAWLFGAPACGAPCHTVGMTGDRAHQCTRGPRAGAEAG